MKNKKKYQFLALVSYAFLLVFYQSPAQSGSGQQQEYLLTGTVTDSYGPLPGVNVMVKGTHTGTFTDKDGKFSLAVQSSNTLVFSYMGYKSLETAVLGRISLEVELQPEATQLQEVEVNAGYYTVKERERTGSISRVTAEEIELQPVSNPLAAMQGRMAGVEIVQTSGVPGAGFNIQIRGRNSIAAGNDPLYVVDGIPYPSQTLGYAQVATILPGQGASPLNSINPQDIQSIEVLKDADATAIYGSRGANGVVLITSKRGKEGKNSLDIIASSGTGVITRKMNLMDTGQYLEMRREAFANDKITEYPANSYDVNGTWNQKRYTDWQKELIGGTAYRTELQGTISGGSEQTRFLVSGGHQKETTVFPGNFYYNKIAVHGNFNHQSRNKKFGLNLTTNYVADKNNLMGTDLTSKALLTPPNAPSLFTKDRQLNWANSSWTNPLNILETKYTALTKNLMANIILTYDLLPGLNMKTSLGYNDLRLNESKITPSTFYNPARGYGGTRSTMYQNTSTLNSWIVEPQLNWERRIGQGRLQILAGATFQEQQQKQTVQLGQGFSSDALIRSIAAAQNLYTLNDDNTLYRYNAVFGRVNFNWQGKYILNLTGRRDGSSRFGPGNQFANFGAIGAVWLFSGENFVTDKWKFLSLGKLRSSFGTSGNDQIGNYQFLDTYQITSSIYDGITGLRPSRLYNSNFGWEVNKKWEGALELGFFHDRILLNIAHFRNISSSQLVGSPLPGTTGFTTIQANLPATVQNLGWELELNTVNIKNKLQWSSNINLTIPKNKLKAFPGLEGSTYANQLVVGKPLHIKKVHQWQGVDPLTGVFKFTDFNGDGTISYSKDREILVSLAPQFYGGLLNKFNYKGWQLDFIFQFIKQNGINYKYSGGRPGGMSNRPEAILDRWQKEGDISDIQRYTAGGNVDANQAYNNLQSSDVAYSDASFIRLKNLGFSYIFPTEWIQNLECRLFLQGQNLFTITNYLGPDPENQSIGNLPPLRMLTLGVQLTF